MTQKSKLETMLNEVKLVLTDKITYFPCRVGRAYTEYPDTYLQEYKRQNVKVLTVACADRYYDNIVENINEALTGKHQKIWELSVYDRNMMQGIMQKHDYIKYSNRRLWQEINGFMPWEK